MNETLLRLRDVETRTGLRRSHLYALAARGEFPKPLKLGDRASAWIEREVSDCNDPPFSAQVRPLKHTP